MNNKSRNAQNTNKASWELVYEKFYGWCALPSWGPYGAGANKNIISIYADKSFLEIGCGSGHTLKFLLQKGASFVHGIDISENQIIKARHLLKNVGHNKCRLTNSSIEKINPKNMGLKYDYVISIFSVEWWTNTQEQFCKIKSLLKKDGYFIFSIEHPVYKTIFGILNQEKKVKSYFKEKSNFINSWAKGNGAHIEHKTISQWFNAIQKAGFVVEKIIEPEPTINEKIQIRSKSLSDYYSNKIKNTAPMTIIFICKNNTQWNTKNI